MIPDYDNDPERKPPRMVCQECGFMRPCTPSELKRHADGKPTRTVKCPKCKSESLTPTGW